MRKTLFYLASFVAIIFLLVLLALATAGVRASPGTLYVKVGGSDLDDCTSTPCASIGYALEQASPGDTIKVAQGTYTENITIDKNVTLEGGYEATGWTRDIEAYETIIDGSGSQTVPGDWDGNDTYGPAVISDTGLYKMWYSGRDLYGTWRIGYAESTNGINWTKSTSNPVLEPGSPGEWDEAGVIQMSVMKDGPTYKMWYTGWDEDGLWQIGYATSTNGLDWVKYAGNPVLEVGSPGAWNEVEVGDPSIILDGTTYKMWYYGSGGAGPTTQVGYATSPDGVDWTESASNPVLMPGSSAEWDDEHVWNPSVLKENSTYKMWYTGSDGDTQRIGYATSSDGVVWNKYAGNPVLDVGSSGEWDQLHVYLPMVISDTGTYRMWYTGRNSNGDWRIGYATSSDGVTWTKYAGNPVLTPGTPGQWADPVVGLGPGSDGAVLDGFTITGGDTDWGGGIEVDDSSPTVRNCTITDNNAFYSGGAIVVWGGSPIIESNTISENTANDEGGGILIYGSTPTISDNLIEGNTAGGGGGILMNENSYGTISGNEIRSNTASGWAGGGIYIGNGSNPTVSGNLIENNHALENGGGINLHDAYATISDNQIFSNTVTIWAGGGINIASGSTATVTRNTISGNIVNGDGGGIQIWSLSSATITDNTITGNTAGWSGGGIVVHDDSTAAIISNRILSNTVVDGDGGGLMIATSVVTVNNNIIGLNDGLSIDWLGDGIFVWGSGSDVQIVNNTIVSNSAEGIEAQAGATVLARNNIIYGNDGGIHNYASGATVSSDHNAFWNNGWDYAWVSPGPGDLSVDPLFVDAANGNYHLMPNSPVIDKGTNVGAPSTDFDGEARPFDGDRDGVATVDIGADEVHTRWIFLPLILKNY